MKHRLTGVVLVVALVTTIACSRDSAEQQRTEYDAIQEGAASGVTTHLQGPGEVLPPLTATNADTTTAFTLDPGAAGTAPVSAAADPTLGTFPPPVHEPTPAYSAPATPRRSEPAASTPATSTPAPSAPSPAAARTQPSTTREPAPARTTTAEERRERQPPPEREPSPAPPPDTDTSNERSRPPDPPRNDPPREPDPPQRDEEPAEEPPPDVNRSR